MAAFETVFPVELDNYALTDRANNKFVVMGDSILQHNTYNGAAPASNWKSDTLYGNRYLAYGPLAQLRAMTDGRVQFEGANNLSVVGETLPQIAARADATIAATDAGTVLLNGGINDRGASGLSLAASQAALASLFTKFRAAKRRIIYILPIGAGGSVVSSNRFAPAQLAIHKQFRLWVKETYGRTPGIALVDPATTMVQPGSPGGDVFSFFFYDDLHPSPAGAYEIAKMILPHIPARLPGVSVNDLFDPALNPAGSLLFNSAMNTPSTGGTAGTGGNGVIAGGWVGGNGGETGHVRAYTKTGRDAQRCVISGTATTAADISILFQNVTNNLAIGDKVVAVANIAVAAGSSGMETVLLKLTDVGNSFALGAADMDYSGAMGSMTDEAFRHRLVTPPMKLTSNSLRVRLDARCQAKALALDVVASDISLFKVA